MKYFRNLLRAIAGARGAVSAIVQTALAQGLTMGVNIVTGVITARLLGPVGRGEFAAASLWLLLPSTLAAYALQNTFIYHVRQRPDQSGSIGFVAWAMATTLFVPLLLICHWLLPLVMHTYSPSIIALGQTALLLSVTNVWLGMFRQWLLATQQFSRANMFLYGVAATYLVLLLVLTACHAVTPASATYAQIGAAGIWLLGAFPGIRRAARRLAVKDWENHLRRLLDYGLRAAPIDMVTVLSQNLDRIMLVMLISPADFGLYVVALSFARSLSIFQSAVSSVMLTLLADQTKSAIQSFTHRCFQVTLFGLLIVCCVTLLVDRTLLKFIYGPPFAAAVPVFRILLLDVALSCLGQILIQAFLACNASGVASGIQVVSFALTAAGMIILTPAWGGIGAATAFAAGSLLRLGLLAAALRRIGIGMPSIIPRRIDCESALRCFRQLAKPSS